jgi:hypothetical protein
MEEDESVKSDLSCIETEDDDLRCEYDRSDEDGEAHLEMVCERQENKGEVHCDIDLIVSGDRAEDFLGEEVEDFSHPETEKEFQSMRSFDDYKEEQRRRERFEEQMMDNQEGEI